MSASDHYTRVLLKLSGNAFAAGDGSGFDRGRIHYIAGEIAAASEAGCAMAVVPGAGNILRGAGFGPDGTARLLADTAGMISTMVNGLVLQQALDGYGIATHLCSALPVAGAVRSFDRAGCMRELDRGAVVILAGGTGNPLFTTDTAAVLRAVQLDMEAVFKATRVRGVFSADPETDGSPTFYSSLSYDEIISARLAVMDFCALALCRDHGMPIRVFNFKEKGNLLRAVSGEPIGTFIGEHDNGS